MVSVDPTPLGATAPGILSEGPCWEKPQANAVARDRTPACARVSLLPPRSRKTHITPTTPRTQETMQLLNPTKVWVKFLGALGVCRKTHMRAALQGAVSPGAADRVFHKPVVRTVLQPKTTAHTPLVEANKTSCGSVRVLAGAKGRHTKTATHRKRAMRPSDTAPAQPHPHNHSYGWVVVSHKAVC